MSSPHSELLRLHKRIFDSLRRESDRLLGETPAAIRRYEREYREDFARARELSKAGLTRAECSKKDLLRAVRGAQVTFVADFHTFPQAQRTALRILRDSFREGETWWVGLELVSSRYQDELDAFQRGDLTLEEFHRRIRYAEEWGFPWANYAPLFQWARDNGVRLIALNRPRELSDPGAPRGATLRRVEDESELPLRDQWAAGVITDLFSSLSPVRRRSARMLVLYGELHIGSRHLPLQLSRLSRRHLGSALRSLRIHQNEDSLFWALARQEREHRTEVLRLGRDSYCVLSATPWTKLQSLVSWAEEDLELEEESTDYLSLMRMYGDAFAELIGLAPASFESLTPVTIEGADFARKLSRREFSTSELALIRERILSNRRIYVPRARIAYLSNPSQNGAAELAGMHVFRETCRQVDLVPVDEERFWLLVLEHAFGFFASLVINPRRKCDLPGDHALSLLRGRPTREERVEHAARKLALAVLRSSLSREPANCPRLRAALKARGRDPAALAEAARYAGAVLGKKMHAAFMEKELDASEIRRAAAKGARTGNWAARYARLAKAVSGSRTARSKADSL